MNAISSATGRLSVRRSLARGTFFMLLAVLAAALLPASAKGQATLTWDPLQNGTGSDGFGTWNTTGSFWGDGGTDTTWPTVSPYANAIIGDGGTLTSTNDTIKLASGATLDLGNITFGALGVGPGYNLEGDYGTSTTANTGFVSNALVLANTGATPSVLIDNTAPSITTNVQTNLVAPSAFTLNVSGTGSLGFGGSIGVSSGTNTGAATLNVGTNTAPFSGTATLSNANNLTSTTINSGVVTITNQSATGGALGPSTSPVTLSGGELQLVQGAIGIQLSGVQANGNAHIALSSTQSAGVYAVPNWTAYQFNRSTTALQNYGTPATDSLGVLTQASIASLAGNNTYSQNGVMPVGSSADVTLNWSGENATSGTPAKLSIQNVPYAQSGYSVYEYVYDNGPVSGQTGTNNAHMSMVSGSTGGATNGSSIYYFQFLQNDTAQQGSTANPSMISYAQLGTATNPATSSNPFIATGSLISSTQTNPPPAGGTATVPYSLWTGLTGSSFGVQVTGGSGGTTNNPILTGVEIVAAPIVVDNTIHVTASSTLAVGQYQTAPIIGGAVNISGGAQLSFTESSATTLPITGTITFGAGGGTLAPQSGMTIQTSAISDGGNGFSLEPYTTSPLSAGTVSMQGDLTGTVTGSVNVGTNVQAAMSTSAGTGALLGNGSLTVQSGGSIGGVGTLRNSSIAINSGGSITGSPAGTFTINPPPTGPVPTLMDNGTLRTTGGAFNINVPVTVGNGGAITSGTGVITISGMTTVSGGATGGTLNVGLNGTAGESIVAAGGLTLAGGTSNFLLINNSGTGASGLVNAADSSLNPSLLVTGTHTIDATYSGALPTVATVYDLMEYSANSPIPTTGGAGSPLVFTGAGQGGQIDFTSTGPGAIPGAYAYTLVDNVSAGSGEYYVQLDLSVPTITWTGQTNGNWDTTTSNWATGSTPTTYSDNAYVVKFTDTNAANGNSPITNSNITIVPSTVSPLGMNFTASSTNYTFSGGAITGSGAILLSGGASVTFESANGGFNGPVNITAGELILQNNNALGTSSGVTVGSGGALALQNGIAIGNIPLSLNGTGWATSSDNPGGPAGALSATGGANSYAGTITLAGAATIEAVNSSDTLALTGGIAAGANNLTFAGAGTTTVSTAGITMTSAGTLATSGTGELVLDVASPSMAGAIQVNAGGTLSLEASGAMGASSGLTVASGATLNLQGGITTNAISLGISGAGVGAGGAITSTGGANNYTGAINLAGSTTIKSSSTTNGDSLTLSGAINAGNNTLTFTGPGITNVSGSISGAGGSVVSSATGTLRLIGTNSYGNGTQINSGSVITGPTGLGSGPVTLNGGTLGLIQSALGLHVASNSATGAYNAITPGFTAGVVPITNWNNMDINHASTAPITSGAAGDTPLPFVLTDSNGIISTANVSAWFGNNGYSSAVGSTGDGQLLSSGLNAVNGGHNPASITIGNIPYSSYNVYVYSWNNLANTPGTMGIASGPNSSSLTTSPTTYYFSSGGGATPTSYVLGGPTASTAVLNANYGVWTGVTGSTLEALETSTAPGSANLNPWIAGVEIVATGLTFSNPVSVNSSSTIDVSNVLSLTMGNLTMQGSPSSNTLNVTGAGMGSGTNYSLNLGAVSLINNAIFNVNNNSSFNGTGTLNLGAIGDSGSTGGASITLTGPGIVGLTSATGSTYRGGTFVQNGTLRLYDMGSNSSSSATGAGPVSVSNSGSLAGPTNIGGASYISGAVAVSPNASPGGTIKGVVGATLNLTGGLTLGNDSTASFALASTPNYPSGPAAIVTSGAAPTSLIVPSNSSITVTLTGAGDPIGTTAGTQYTYELMSYTGTALPSATWSSANPGGTAGTLTFSNGATMTIPSGGSAPGPFANFQLIDNTSAKQIDLVYTAYNETWTGDSNSNWSTSASDVNWAAGPGPSAAAASYLDPANVTFGDYDATSATPNTPVINTNVSIQSGGVFPSSVTFTNNSSAYTISNANNPNTGSPDITGIGGSTGITINGTAGVTFGDGNTFTGAVQINAGYLQTYTSSVPTPNANLNVNGLGNASSVSVASGGELQLGSTSFAFENSYYYGITANGLSTIPLTIAGPGAPAASNGMGALSSAGGINTYFGPISLSGDATINSNSSDPAQSLTLFGGVNTAGHVLTFNGPGGTVIPSSITGSGSIANTGGTVTLSGNNSFSGGVNVISGGTVAVAGNSGLGTGTVTLAGGNLNFTQGSVVSLNVAANLSGQSSVASLAASQIAGVVPAVNWNNLTVPSNGNIPIGSAAPYTVPPGSTPTPFALNDSSGVASGASLTSWSSGNTYAVAGSPNGSFQMLSSWLSTFLYPQANVTISNIPYSQYAVYLYFYNNIASYNVLSVSGSSTSYYASTYANGATPSLFTQATTTLNPGVTNSSGAYPTADYAVWTGQTGSSLTATVAAAEVGGNGAGGISGVQIVNEAPVYTNPVSVTMDSAIDLTGVSSVTMGTLAIGGNTLTVTGGSIGSNIPYSLTFGATTLNGSPNLNITNNGTGTATLTVGAITDAGSGDNVTINGNSGNGTVVFAGGGNYTGSTTIDGGTLRVVGALASNVGVTVNSGATLSGPTTVGQNASIAGAVGLSGNIAATDGAKLSLNGGLIIEGGAATFTLAGAPSGQAIIATSGATPSLNIQNSQSINIARLPDAAPGTWTYDLYGYTGGPLSPTGNGTNTLTYTGGSLSLGSTVSGPFTYSLTDTGSQVDLSVSAYALQWNGRAAGAWDTTSSNWQYSHAGINSSNYVDGAYVTFGDNNLNSSQVSNNAGLATVTVQPTGVNPGQVSFTNTGAGSGGVDYLVNGGAIGGASTTVSKSGAGSATLDNNNTYGGGTTISAGTLVAGTTAALGSGAVTLSGGTLRLGTSVVGFNGTPGTNTSPTWTTFENGFAATDFMFPSTTINGLPGNGNTLYLTDGLANVTSNAFYNTQVPVGATTTGFKAQFVYAANPSATSANGMTFILQNTSAGASATGYLSSAGTTGGGTGGNGMGFSNIYPSVGFEINLLASQTVGVAWEADGVTNGTVSTQFSAVNGINFASGDPILISLSYNPSNTTLTTNFTDETTHATGTYTNSSINVASALGGSMAYVGFGATTGGSTALQAVNNFSYAVGGSYANNVSLTGGDTSTIDVAANGALSADSIGTLTFGAGSPTTLNVTAATAPSGQSYSLTTGTVTLLSNANINVANAAGGGAGALNIGQLVTSGATPTLQINPTAGNSGTVSSSAAPNLANNTSLSVVAGTLAFNVNSGSATLGTNVATAVASGATLQLAGTVSALANNSTAVTVSNNGSLTEVGASTQTVGIVSGTSGTDVNGATIYGGNTTVGDGTNAATLNAAEILQNSLTIAANSTVAIVPSGPSGPAVSSSVASDSSSAAAASSSSSGSTGDAYAAIEAALASSSSSHDAVTELRSLESSDPGLTLTPGDDVDLYHNFQLASNGVWLGAANSGAAATPTLLGDLANDGLTPAEISSLVGSAADPAPVTLGGIGSLSPSLAIAGSSAAPVPEPSTLVLAALGLVALGLKLRRYRLHPRSRQRRSILPIGSTMGMPLA